MSWSFPIARVLGTQIRIHLAFFILPIYFGFMGYEVAGVPGAIYGACFILALFFCVLLHEYGHTLAARAFGIRTPTITLLPIGGLARMERIPRKPAHELVIALAGPLVNVVIAGLIAGYFLITAGQIPVPDVSAPPPDEGPNFIVYTNAYDVMVWMMWVNGILAVFNMLPAFPMDGGRVLRAFLALMMPYVRATAVAATLGQLLAFVAAYWALSAFDERFMLFFVAIFVFIGAGREASHARMRDSILGLKVADAMVRRFQTLSPRATLGEASDALLAGAQPDFPVVSEGKVVGILSRSNLALGLRKHGLEGFVELVMTPSCPPVLEVEDLEEATLLLNPKTQPIVPVAAFEDGPLTGLLTHDNLGEAMMIRSALRSRV